MDFFHDAYKPHLRDGVDVYYIPESDEVNFVFVASRKRIKIKCQPILVQSLSWMTGENTVAELMGKFMDKNGDSDALLHFLSYLKSRGLLIDAGWLSNIDLPTKYKERLTKQLNFILDLVDSADKVETIQKRIFNAKIAIFGLGAVGSWICRELVMVGFRNFILIDHDTVAFPDISRHAYFHNEDIVSLKVDVVKRMVLSIDASSEVSCIKEALTIDTELENILHDVDLVINSADEPYIGYTSLKLSRFCVKKDKPIFVAGGFDAHLGCLGELIIPRITPCSDCYNQFFKKALEGWKPIEHPVTERRSSFGGLCSLTVFSASTAVMSIGYFIDPDGASSGGRGELLFDEYKLDAFDVERNPNCRICGDTSAK